MKAVRCALCWFRGGFIAAAAWGGFAAGCQPARPTPAQAAPPGEALAARPGAFKNVSKQVGIDFVHSNGETGRYILLSTTPGGCAFLDFDQDGLLDILLVQAGPTPDKPLTSPRPPCHLYRNLGGAPGGTRFEDVTRRSGLGDIDQGFAHAAAVGDYDNDGFPDVYLTAYGGNRLLRNDGRGRFEDVTRHAGVGDADRGGRWATSAAWGDYDRDGDLDLIVLHYAHWTPATNRTCSNTNRQITYCSPEIYDDKEFPRLYRNEGGPPGRPRFRDVTTETGVDQARGRGLGVLFTDVDHDVWPDIYIACDITPNLLLQNQKGKRFKEVALTAGVAYGADAAVLSGMGITAGDYENRGWESLIVTNFSGQPNSVYRPTGQGFFEDVTYQSGIGEPSMHFLAFGIESLDYNNDAWLDVVVGNGHVDPYIADISVNSTYKERKLLFKNVGKGRFEDAVSDLGDLAEERVTRGLAAGDFDNDGRVDLLDNSHNLPAALYRNTSDGGHFASFRLEGVRSNRDAVGAHVVLSSGGRRRLAEVRDGSSYASTSDRRLHFGLGDARELEKLEVRWPSGQRQTFSKLAADRHYYLREGANPIPDPRVP